MPSDAMLSVVLLVQPEDKVEPLRQTLKTVEWAGEILIADSAGLNLSVMESNAPIVQLPLAGCSEVVLRYRGGLSATNSWVLFLKTGDRVSEELEEHIRSIIQERWSSANAYAFPRKIVWQDIGWIEPVSSLVPDLVNRDAYLESLITCKNLVVQSRAVPLGHRIPSERLISSVKEMSDLKAHQQLNQEGLPSIQARFRISWPMEIIGIILVQGVLKGGFFRGHSRRMSLLISLLRVHFQWLRLYSYWTYGKSPKGYLEKRSL